MLIDWAIDCDRASMCIARARVCVQVMYPAIERYLDETVARELQLINADR